MAGADAAADGQRAERWPRATILVVDDEPGMRHFLEKALRPRVAAVLSAATADEAESLVDAHRVDVVVLDIALPDRNGIELLKDLRAQGVAAEVVLITAYADLDTAIEALRAGAGDLLLKPFRVSQLIGAIGHALERAQLRRENRVLRHTLARRGATAERFVGSSIAVKGLQAAIGRVAPVDSTVLISGESGTGKELAALTLHRGSARADGPFVAVNCGTSDPAQLEAELFGHSGGEGLIAHAIGGTLFLDEVGELPMTLQPALLRVLEDRRVRPVGGRRDVPVDVRIIAATNRDLDADVKAGRFRSDLYYRLQVVQIRMPPLRAHKEDIPALAAHFIHTIAQRLGVAPIEISDDELGYLGQYDWPGNVRELRNLIERSLIVGALNVSALYRAMSRPDADAVPAPSTPAMRRPTDLHTLERQHMQAVLASVGGDKTRAAELLGVSRRTLERRAAEWGQA